MAYGKGHKDSCSLMDPTVHAEVSRVVMDQTESLSGHRVSRKRLDPCRSSGWIFLSASCPRPALLWIWYLLLLPLDILLCSEIVLQDTVVLAAEYRCKYVLLSCYLKHSRALWSTLEHSGAFWSTLEHSEERIGKKISLLTLIIGWRRAFSLGLMFFLISRLKINCKNTGRAKLLGSGFLGMTQNGFRASHDGGKC